MKSIKWENILVQYFTTVKALDDECESIRVELCNNTSFIPSTLFSYLDKGTKKFLSLNDFQTFLNDRNTSYNEQSLRRFIHNFDKDEDFAIDYNEYLDMILPRYNDSLRKEVSERKGKDEEIDNNVEISFIKILQQEMNIVKVLAGIAQELKDSREFTTYEGFLCIAGDQKYITDQNLNKFLKDNGVNYSQPEINTIMFRIDSDNDDKISYDEFQEIFFPFGEFPSNSSSINQIEKDNQNKNTNEDVHYEYSKNNNQKLSKQNKQINQYQDIPKNNKKEYIGEREICPQYQNQKMLPLDYGEKTNSIINQNTYSQDNYPKSSSLMKENMRMMSMSNGEQNYSTSPYLKKNNDIVPQFNNTYSLSYLNKNNDYIQQSKPYTSRLKSSIEIGSSQISNKTPFYDPRAEQAQNYPQRRTYAFSPIKTSPIRQHQNSLSSYQINSSFNSNTNPLNLNLSFSLDGDRKKNLFNLLNDFIEKDIELEKYKENLAFCQDANLSNLFCFFDYSQRQSITSIDLSNAMKEIGSSISINEIKLIYKRYDRNLDGRLE